ncbi:hypothetical protein Ade02nite_20810 [Paractinoplanes deccanensis]|uniref:Uncharacterized protein n=1 Tax=Paractinoplanes deccanensis TaxID=113561 RepID=A0ABQ3Y0Q6_9ACTN|nr:hypothetical protein [Actinoplanes deccanensis]GID73440.1 hypothetical protein Ade02nite_20810 [Actinoplanes deccanensis]
MRTKRYDETAGVFVLSEPGRAVTFEVSPACIRIHSSKRLRNMPPPAGFCPVIDGACHEDGSGAHGTQLRDRWEANGRDEAVMWAELNAWFDSYFNRKAA